MNRRERIVLEKIAREIDVIEKLLYGYTEEKFQSDDRTQRAVAMTFINIGELVKVLPMEIRIEYKDVKWKAIAGMRDIVAHQYQTLKMKDIWVTTQNDIPILKEQLNRILSK
jgi:uncharacterized protein with HEPN domain